MSVHADQVEITSPCPIQLDRSGVSPADRAMHCAHCVKDVHILSNMTEREARDFLADRAGEDICVSYNMSPEGQIRFKPEPQLVPVSALRRRPEPRRQAPRAQPRRLAARKPAKVSVLATTLGTALMLAACAPHSGTDGMRDDRIEVEAPRDQPVIPTQVDEPCNPNEVEPDIQVDGGIEAVPVRDVPVAGGLRAEPIDEPPMPPGGEELQVEGGIKAQPIIEDPVPPRDTRRGRVARVEPLVDRSPHPEPDPFPDSNRGPGRIGQ